MVKKSVHKTEWVFLSWTHFFQPEVNRKNRRISKQKKIRLQFLLLTGLGWSGEPGVAHRFTYSFFVASISSKYSRTTPRRRLISTFLYYSLRHVRCFTAATTVSFRFAIRRDIPPSDFDRHLLLATDSGNDESSAIDAKAIIIEIDDYMYISNQKFPRSKCR